MSREFNFEVGMIVEIHGWITLQADANLPDDVSKDQLLAWATKKLEAKHHIQLEGQEVINVECVTDIDWDD